MRIALLYIAIGKYARFFGRFRRSCDRFFIPGAEKEYFVFTDSDNPIFTLPGVHRVRQENMGWPDNTLQRFRLFCSVREQLAGFDYLFFFNANTVFEQAVEAAALPKSGLIFVRHPGYYDKPPSVFPYERDPRSLACIPGGQGEHYFYGAANGGTRDAYMRMARELETRTDTDSENGIVAVYHDESHINRYALDLSATDYTVWGPEYAYPELYYLPGVEMRVRLLEKDRYFGVAKTRGSRRGLPKTIAHLACVWGRYFLSSLRRRLAGA